MRLINKTKKGHNMGKKTEFSKISPVTEEYVLTFGRYKGLPISIVLEENPEYLLWAENNIAFFMLSRSLWEKSINTILTNIATNREKKEELIAETNERIEKLSEEEKDKRRKLYYLRRKSAC